jgi:hypothetical protein
VVVAEQHAPASNRSEAADSSLNVHSFTLFMQLQVAATKKISCKAVYIVYNTSLTGLFNIKILPLAV